MAYLKDVTVDVKDRLIFLVLTFFLSGIGIVIYYLISNGDDNVSKMKRYVSLQFIVLFGVGLTYLALIILLEIAAILTHSRLLQLLVLFVVLLIGVVFALYSLIYFILFLVKGRCDMIGISSIAQRCIS